MQVYLKVPVIVKVMKGQSHGQGRAIKRQLSGVNSSKVRAKSNTGGSKEAPGDCNAPFSSNSILIFLRNANMPMMIKSMVQKISSTRWIRWNLKCARRKAFWNPGSRNPCARICYLLHWTGGAQHQVYNILYILHICTHLYIYALPLYWERNLRVRCEL